MIELKYASSDVSRVTERDVALLIGRAENRQTAIVIMLEYQ